MENNEKNQGCSCSFAGIGLLLLIISLFSGGLTLRAVGTGLLTLGCLKTFYDMIFTKNVIESIIPSWNPLQRISKSAIKVHAYQAVAGFFLWGGWCAHCIARIYEYPKQVTEIIFWVFIIALPIIFYALTYIKKKNTEKEIIDEALKEEKQFYRKRQGYSPYDENYRGKQEPQVEDVDYEEVKEE